MATRTTTATSRTSTTATRASVPPLFRIALWLLTALGVCITLFFIPNGATPFDASRLVVVELLTLSIAVLWLLTQLQSTEIRIPRSRTLFSWLLIVCVALIASPFTGSVRYSLIGWGIESTTVFTLFICALLLFLIPTLLQTRKRIILFLLTLASSASLVLLYSVLRVVGAPLLGRFTWFVSLPPSIIGTWNELALFAGITVLGVSLVLDLFLPIPSRVLRVIIRTIYVLALCVLIFINHSISWAFVGVLALILTAFVLIKHRSSRSIPYYTVLLLVCASIFLFFGKTGGLLGDTVVRLNTFIGVPSSFTVDVRPSLSDTGAVTLSTFKKYPVLGVGPNFFTYAWMQFRPVTVNQSLGWGTDFALAWSYLATFPILFGVVGLLALLLFIGGFFVDVFAVLTRGSRTADSPLTLTVIALTLYGWFVIAFYTPGVIWVLLFFVLAGVLIATGRESGSIGTISRTFENNSRLVLVSSGGIVLSIILIAGLGYVVASKASARMSFFKGVRVANVQGDLGGAETAMLRALTNDSQDVYSRALSTIESFRLGRIAQDTSLSQEQVQAQFLQAMKLSLDTASSSVLMVPRNYQNVLTLGSVYEAAAHYGVKGAKEQALSTYAQAAQLAPTLPLIPYLQARLEATTGNAGAARKSLETALSLKADYPDAILLLSQIEEAAGNSNTAATIAERAFSAAPNDLTVLFQLGYLKYKIGHYNDARLVLERTRALSPSYSNAKYFLGLTYDALGSHDFALQEFSDILRLNPNNKEIIQIISNIKNGFPALSGVEASPLPEQNDTATSSASKK